MTEQKKVAEAIDWGIRDGYIDVAAVPAERPEQTGHTPLPWKRSNRAIVAGKTDEDGNPLVIAFPYGTSKNISLKLAPEFSIPSQNEAQANADYIVTACNNYESLRKSHAALMEQATVLLDAMETCHICQGALLLQEEAVHCEDCSVDCENHEEPECTPIYVLHRSLRKSIANARKITEGL